jgi:hypothetical protein
MRLKDAMGGIGSVWWLPMLVVVAGALLGLPPLAACGAGLAAGLSLSGSI